MITGGVAPFSQIVIPSLIPKATFIDFRSFVMTTGDAKVWIPPSLSTSEQSDVLTPALVYRTPVMSAPVLFRLLAVTIATQLALPLKLVS